MVLVFVLYRGLTKLKGKNRDRPLYICYSTIQMSCVSTVGSKLMIC